MFELLDLNKVIHYKEPEGSMTYADALALLAEGLGLPRNTAVTEIENIIKNAIFQIGISLNRHDVGENPEFNEIVRIFHRWVQDMHSERLTTGPNSTSPWPNNIVYDMLSLLRQNELKFLPEDSFLHFFLEGANGRKINKGETPGPDFIETLLLVRQLAILKELNLAEANDIAFLNRYESLRVYEDAQENLKSLVNCLKNEDKMFKFLATAQEQIFDFDKSKNEATGANAYDLKKSIEKSEAAINRYLSKWFLEDFDRMVCNLVKYLPTILQQFEHANESATDAARSIAYWNASEWLSRLFVALEFALIRMRDDSVLSKGSQVPKLLLDDIKNNPIVSDIYERSLKGDFPAKTLNEAVEAIPLCELFFQTSFAKEKCRLGRP